jgi:hypothetical protein
VEEDGIKVVFEVAKFKILDILRAGVLCDAALAASGFFSFFFKKNLKKNYNIHSKTSKKIVIHYHILFHSRKKPRKSPDFYVQIGNSQ